MVVLPLTLFGVVLWHIGFIHTHCSCKNLHPVFKNWDIKGFMPSAMIYVQCSLCSCALRKPLRPSPLPPSNRIWYFVLVAGIYTLSLWFDYHRQNSPNWIHHEYDLTCCSCKSFTNLYSCNNRYHWNTLVPFQRVTWICWLKMATCQPGPKGLTQNCHQTLVIVNWLLRHPRLWGFTDGKHDFNHLGLFKSFCLIEPAYRDDVSETRTSGSVPSSYRRETEPMLPWALLSFDTLIGNLYETIFIKGSIKVYIYILTKMLHSRRSCGIFISLQPAVEHPK